ncbi:MAG TPA: response regulator transcription factor [Thermoanaerobaculia bacterium]|nr:response regulator transcription factor [Thermoanaerobaculia bacterium]
MSRSVCLCVRHPLVLQELSRLIVGESFRPLAFKIDSSAAGSSAPLRLPRASVYVVDSPSRREETEYLISEILGRFPRARVLIVAEKLDEAASFAFLRLGVRGLLRYSELPLQLVQALRTLVAGGSWIPRKFFVRFIDKTLRSVRKPAVRPSGATLSRRENEVLGLLLENLSNKEIASRLQISSRTAKFHVSNLLAKYGVKKRADLLMMRSA